MKKEGKCFAEQGGIGLKTEMQKRALNLTQQIMEHWYALDLAPVKAALDENASWIGGAAGQFYMGKSAVLEGLQLASSHMMPCMVSAQTYEIADTGADWCIITGNISVTLKNESMLLHEPQRLTFVWRLRGADLRVSHMHVSNNMAAIAPDEDFPIKASKQAYEYLTKNINGGAVTVLSSDRILYRLQRDAVRYLSAANEYMIIHSQKEDIRLHRRLGAVYKELFPHFLAIHRSYCVNPDFLRAMWQFEAELTDGTRLPVSRERYAALCAQLGVKL